MEAIFAIVVAFEPTIWMIAYKDVKSLDGHVTISYQQQPNLENKEIQCIWSQKCPVHLRDQGSSTK
jgi:hypothetical protein